jgi:hypothetical protein
VGNLLTSPNAAVVIKISTNPVQDISSHHLKTKNHHRPCIFKFFSRETADEAEKPSINILSIIS